MPTSYKLQQLAGQKESRPVSFSISSTSDGQEVGQGICWCGAGCDLQSYSRLCSPHPETPEAENSPSIRHMLSPFARFKMGMSVTKSRGIETSTRVEQGDSFFEDDMA